ncbi:MAG: hypothetical protein N4A72_08830 [Bacteroidales bacterium]|jgi:hypothetical protein|nr:hypothetical protein [Bacteroidales bacterium]
MKKGVVAGLYQLKGQNLRFNKHSFLKLIVVFNLLIISLIGCSKSDSESNNVLKEGQIIGYSSDKCACCQGWIIQIESITIKVLNLPEESRINELVKTKGYPIPIKLKYGEESGDCSNQYKRVTMVEVLE